MTGRTMRGRRAPRRAPYVIVVDDVADNREMYAEYLAHSGVRVSSTESAEDALDLITSDVPDVVVMDLALPGMDGWEATRRIKRDPRTKHVHVVVVTGHVLLDHLRAARDAGATEILVKPFVPSALFERIAPLLHRSERG